MNGTRQTCFTLALLGAACVTGHAAATDVFIADGDVAGLIAAINAANAETDQPAVINLAENGTYTLTEVNNSGIFGPNGLPVIETEITINANGSTIERSSELGTPDFRILIVLGPPSGFNGNLTLNDATITGGQTPSGAAGIALNGTVTVVNCTISNNSSGINGGGIGNSTDGVLTVIDSTITGNWANSNGGGIRNFPDAASATVINSIITDNATTGNGGGIDNRAPMTVINSTIAGNTSGNNGGGIANMALLTLSESTIGGNTASFGEGGGVWHSPAGCGSCDGYCGMQTPEGCWCDDLCCDFDDCCPDKVDFCGGCDDGVVPCEALSINDTTFCNNDPDHISGQFDDLGGNEFSDTCPPDCAPADLNCDGVVNVSDLLILFDNWGECADCGDCPADLNDDCEVNVSDLLILFDNWG